MDEKQCKDCQYYIQHYTYDKEKFFRVYCGHCTYSRVRRKLPDAKACENYVEGSPREDAFVSKEYLCKALLEYMTSLELLPEIDDRG